MTAESYPLAWPPGWPRRKKQQDSDRRFSGPTYRWDRVFRGLQDEIRRIGGTDIVISTNQPVRGDGLPYAQTRNITDPGVAVYFMRRGKPVVMAQDRFDTVMGNMRSLALAIDGLRQMERHGGARMLERAFAGFTAISPPESHWSILGIDETIIRRMRVKEKWPGECRDLVMDFFRQRVRESHGTGADMDRLVKARDKALEAING